jgi:hypothetical protein
MHRSCITLFTLFITAIAIRLFACMVGWLGCFLYSVFCFCCELFHMLCVCVCRREQARPALVPASVLAARSDSAMGDADDDDDDDAERMGMGLTAMPVGLGMSLAGPRHPPKLRSGRTTERDIEAQQGGPGVYNPDFRLKHFVLADESWRTDNVPEIMDGKNVADFIDPEIEARLAELEAEEDELERAAEAAGTMDDDWDLDEDQEQVLQEIKVKKAAIKSDAAFRKNKDKVVIPRTKRVPKTLTEFEDHLQSLGIDASAVTERARSLSRGRASSRAEAEAEERGGASVLGKRRARSRTRGDMDEADMGDSASAGPSRTGSRSGSAAAITAAARAASRSASRSGASAPKSKSRPPSANVPVGGEGLRNVKVSEWVWVGVVVVIVLARQVGPLVHCYDSFRPIVRHASTFPSSFNSFVPCGFCVCVCMCVCG